MRGRSCITGGGTTHPREGRAPADWEGVLSRRVRRTGPGAGGGGVWRARGDGRGEQGRRPASGRPALTRALLGRQQQGGEPQEPRVHRPPPAAAAPALHAGESAASGGAPTAEAFRPQPFGARCLILSQVASRGRGGERGGGEKEKGEGGAEFSGYSAGKYASDRVWAGAFSPCSPTLQRALETAGGLVTRELTGRRP